MDTWDEAKAVAKMMAASAEAPYEQIEQTFCRLQLVEEWQIPMGASVLEIGCGQGDMTAALAYRAGASGHVTAVDLASPNYGAPVTIGESASRLKQSPLGAQIDFHFEFDVLDPSIAFSPDRFDYVILAHCSWYFESLNHLRRLLLRVRPWARHLCIAEWDLEPRVFSQIAHLLSVLIQGQVEAYKTNSLSNVRTPYSKTRLRQLLAECGWRLLAESALDTSVLKDSDWEIDICLKQSMKDALALNLPVKHMELLESQIDTLKQVASLGLNRSLYAYAIIAERIR